MSSTPLGMRIDGTFFFDHKARRRCAGVVTRTAGALLPRSHCLFSIIVPCSIVYL